MEINKKNRQELKRYFVKNAIPTASNFGDLIDATFNQAEDGIIKQPGSPLSIAAETGSKKLINFYNDFSESNAAWSFSQSAKMNSDARESTGFSVNDAGGSSRIFIENGSGNVGVGTVSPKSVLDVNGALKATSLEITGNAKASGLEVNGSVKIKAPRLETTDGELKLGGFSTEEKEEWPNVTWSRDLTKKWDEGLIKLPLSNGKFGKSGFGIHMHESRHFAFYSTGADTLFDIEGKSGNVFIKGNVGLGITPTATSAKLEIDGAIKLNSATVKGKMAIDTGLGLINSASIDYIKFQFTMSGGGIISWDGSRLKWTKRFIVLSSKGNSYTIFDGHISVNMPTADIPAANVYDGAARSVANGVLLTGWDSLYAVHEIGSNSASVSFRIVRWDKQVDTPANWIFIAQFNEDDGSLKLGTGAVLAKGSSIEPGSGRIKDKTGDVMPVGSIIAYGGSAMPQGWLLCNGAGIPAQYTDLIGVVGANTPDLRSRFIVGAGQGGGLSNYNLKQAGGAEVHTLNVNEMPNHQHFSFGEATSSWPYGIIGSPGGVGSRGGYDNDNYLYGTTAAGGNAAHNNLPPYYALTYIIKC